MCQLLSIITCMIYNAVAVRGVRHPLDYQNGCFIIFLLSLHFFLLCSRGLITTMCACYTILYKLYERLWYGWTDQNLRLVVLEHTVCVHKPPGIVLF